MIQRGIVQEVTENGATVAVGGGEGCGACSSRESCMSITGRRPEAKLVTVENTLGASKGDAVELELPVSATMRIIGLTFILPVALLIAGYWTLMPGGALRGALGAAGGLLLGMIVAMAANRSMGKDPKYRMRMTRILEKNCEGTEVLQ